MAGDHRLGTTFAVSKADALSVFESNLHGTLFPRVGAVYYAPLTGAFATELWEETGSLALLPRLLNCVVDSNLGNLPETVKRPSIQNTSFVH